MHNNRMSCARFEYVVEFDDKWPLGALVLLVRVVLHRLMSKELSRDAAVSVFIQGQQV